MSSDDENVVNDETPLLSKQGKGNCVVPPLLTPSLRGVDKLCYPVSQENFGYENDFSKTNVIRRKDILFDHSRDLVKRNTSRPNTNSSCDTPKLHDSSSYLEKDFESMQLKGRNAVPLGSGIVCVFVVAFESRTGNIVEWVYPEECDVSGLEFKAFVSGAHRVQHDFIYFKQGQAFGLACFENMKVDCETERGARMKSVGILSPNYAVLHKHKEFLQEQVRFLLNTPGCYNKLKMFYKANKENFCSGIYQHCGTSQNKESFVWSYNNLHQYVLNTKVSHPTECFCHLMNFFGEQLFLLWKFALLKKRILFYSPPPVGTVCYRVYCTSCLVRHSVADIDLRVTQPLFYVSLSDIALLEDTKVFIACTTEKIFETKKSLYDLYIDNQNMKVDTPFYQKLLTLSSADRIKFNHLRQLRSEQAPGLSERDLVDDESWFINYFQMLNNKLFNTLLDVSKTPEKQWTNQHMLQVGLDPDTDQLFVMELIDTYGIDIMMMVNTNCCPA
ncbi:protein LCHN-like [Limulus polyphemus]|uniref:DENN domain-containing protein 11 n=1 Tax=Limulus polyphemus TaxID=6850 RepID=A0ABM1B3U6_LIMPO|nr:protein LCHN-like [Limulus polyphemus]